MADPKDREDNPPAETRTFDEDLGEGLPVNVDLHKLGLSDNPQEDWGEPGDEGATFSSTNARRGEVTLGQGTKTRAATKDIISRRG